MKYEIGEQVHKNLLSFLDRVEYKGIKEIYAINEILQSLNNPVNEENNNE